jgi:dihydroorotase
MMYSLVIDNAKVLFGNDIVSCSIGVEEGRIARIAKLVEGEERFDARGLLALPGIIDSHVHFRDMGQEEKEDWLSGSKSAIYGGVTAVVDMPNTDPPTFDEESFSVKLTVAKNRSMIDFALNAGVSGNLKQLPLLWKRGALAFGEIFMAKSTGGFSVGDDELREALKAIEKLGGTASIHAEDESVIAAEKERLAKDTGADVYSRLRPREAEIEAVEKAVELARQTKVAMHITHVSTSKAVQLMQGEGITCDVTPHHLFLIMKDWDRLGARAKMNPPIRHRDDVEALWRAVRDGSIDVLASDHAPHTKDEKSADVRSAPAGVPGVETMAPLMLKAVADGKLALQRFIDMTSLNPARIFGISGKGQIKEGYDADFAFVDMSKPRMIRATDLHCKCGWTPYEGFEGIFPQAVIQRGDVLLDGNEFYGRRGAGKFIRGRGYASGLKAALRR